MTGKERESTFAFADLAGFTALTEIHGDQRAAELAGDFCDLVRGLLRENDAELIKTIGDAVMLRSDGAGAGVELGLRILESAAERDDFPAVRIGMHTGPAVDRGGDWFGATVNVAARVAAAAAGGEVLLSEATARTAQAMKDIDLRRHGEERLRNVREPILLFQAVRASGETRDVPIDPVCRMRVAPNHAAGSLIYQGHEYFFCSLRCAAEFSTEPAAFVEAG